MKRTWIFALLPVLLIGGAPTAGATEDPLATSTSIVEDPLAPGDAVRLRFWREPELNGQYGVDEALDVVLPLLGVWSVLDRSPSDLKAELITAYQEQLQNQQIEVTPLRRVRVLGAVRVPGLYHVDATMTLADAVALAGGQTIEGKLSGVRLLRNDQEIRSDLDGSELVSEQIRSGDQIVVERRSWFSRNSTAIVGGLMSAAAIIISAAAF